MIKRRTDGSVSGPPNDAADDGHAALQLLVNPFELVGALQLIRSQPEACQHDHEQQSVPELQTPADGVEEHFYSMQ